MGKLTFDTVDGFGADIGARGGRILRPFMLENIDTSIPTHEIAGFVQFYDGSLDVNSVAMTDMGSAHPDSRYAGYTQQNIVIRGLLHDAVVGAVVYTQDPSGFTPTTYVVTRTRQPVQHMETILPDFPGQPGDVITASLNVFTIPVDFVPMQFKRTSPVIIFEGLKVGEPDDSGSDYQGYVNQGEFRSKPTGHWYLDDYTTSYSRYSGYSQFRIAIQRNILGRDWRSWGTLFNAQVGKYVKVNPAHVADALDEPYKYGQIGPNYNGFVCVGGYPTIDFESIGVPTI